VLAGGYYYLYLAKTLLLSVDPIVVAISAGVIAGIFSRQSAPIILVVSLRNYEQWLPVFADLIGYGSAATADPTLCTTRRGATDWVIEFANFGARWRNGSNIWRHAVSKVGITRGVDSESASWSDLGFYRYCFCCYVYPAV
jgi:hypothetical protein